MLILTFFVAGALAHNWLQSLSRTSPTANKSPIPDSTNGDKPHVQVIAGQEFQIEWVTGHSGDHYFVFVAADDERSLSRHTTGPTGSLEKYLAGQGTGTHNTRYQKYHRKLDDSPKQAYTHLDTYIDNRYAMPHLRETDAGFIKRPTIFKGMIKNTPQLPTTDANLRQAKYNRTACATCVDDDKRAFYKNNDYPWIIGMHRYRHAVQEPMRADVALFSFPTTTKPGDYLVHSIWNGYYDIIDVRIVAGTTNVPEDQIYFKPEAFVPDVDMMYKRIDHCMFIDATPAGTCKKIITDVRSCAIECDSKDGDGCQGINVVPVIAQPDVYAAFAGVSLLPRNGVNCSYAELTLNATAGTRACYAVKSREVTDLLPAYQTFTDPEDPRFYSTCWLRTPILRSGKVTPTKRPLEYRFEQRCSTCQDAMLAKLDRFQPKWNLPTVCIDCANDGPDNSTLPNVADYNVDVPWSMELGKSHCTGVDSEKVPAACTSNDDCMAPLYPPSGQFGDVSERDCYALAKADARCDKANNVAYLPKGHPRKCYCFTGKACCGGCNSVTTGNYMSYKV